MKRIPKTPDLRGLLLVVFAIAWIAGILLNSWLHFPALPLLIGAGLAAISIAAYWYLHRKDLNWEMLFLLALFWLLFGAWRYALSSPIGDPTAISAFIGQQHISIRGIVADEPKLQTHSRLLTIDVNGINTTGGYSWQSAHGQLEVIILGNTLDDPYGPHYGDSVTLTGALHPPSAHSTPNLLASMTFPRLIVGSSGGNPFISALYSLRLHLATILEQALPQPMAALLIAILLSLRTPALKPYIPAFNETNTAHLIAPSGLKVTILAGLIIAITRLYEKPGKQHQFRWMLPAQKRAQNRRQWISTSFIVFCILCYTFLSGGGPAAMRAGIMGILAAIAPRFGRYYNVYNALAFAVLLMSLLNPFVFWDAGFQLSFFGTLGIVLLTPFFQRLLRPLEHLPLAGHILSEIIAVTFAAEVATLPIFALTFSQISFIAPLTNLLTVPPLGIFLALGSCICLVGLLSLQAAMLIGWIIWPLLWYLLHVVSWSASLPGAYLNVSNIDGRLAWIYYAFLLIVLAGTPLRKWTSTQHSGLLKKPKPVLSKRSRLILQLCAVLIVMLATGITAATASANGQLTITFLSVGPAIQPPQGEAILIRTANGKTALIDGGLDVTSLSEELDGRLPSWQRTLDLVMLTSPRQDHLTALQDVLTRYQVGEVADAGMLHPSTGYALFRRTINERGITYLQVRQGAIITLGQQVAFQVFWPSSPLHKGSAEELDNGLIVRLLAPGIRSLLVGAAALSKHALDGLETTLDHHYLQADVVQIMGEVNKAFPTVLSDVLQQAHPSLLVITPAAISGKLHKTVHSTLVQAPQVPGASWQVMQTAQTGSFDIISRDNNWNIATG